MVALDEILKQGEELKKTKAKLAQKEEELASQKTQLDAQTRLYNDALSQLDKEKSAYTAELQAFREQYSQLTSIAKELGTGDLEKKVEALAPSEEKKAVKLDYAALDKVNVHKKIVYVLAAYEGHLKFSEINELLSRYNITKGTVGGQLFALKKKGLVKAPQKGAYCLTTEGYAYLHEMEKAEKEGPSKAEGKKRAKKTTKAEPRELVSVPELSDKDKGTLEHICNLWKDGIPATAKVVNGRDTKNLLANGAVYVDQVGGQEVLVPSSENTYIFKRFLDAVKKDKDAPLDAQKTAKELDTSTEDVRKLVHGFKTSGIYDAKLADISKIEIYDTTTLKSRITMARKVGKASITTNDLENITHLSRKDLIAHKEGIESALNDALQKECPDKEGIILNLEIINDKLVGKIKKK